MSNTNDQLVADYLRRLAAAAASLPADRRDELIEEISAHIAEARAVSPDAAEESEVGTSVAATLARLGDPDQIVRAAAEQAGAGQFGGRAGPGGEPVAGGPASTGGFGPGDAGGRGPGDPGSYGPGRAYPGWPASYDPSRPMASGMGALEIAAVILLLVGGFLAGIGWIVGVVLLWISPRWRLSDKLLGTLIWPGGLAGALIVLTGVAFFPVETASTACYGGSATSSSSSGLDQTSSQNCGNAGAAIPSWLTVTLLIVAVVLAIGGPILVTIRLVRQARREQRAYAATA
jgi:hypothetical protein